MKKTVLNALEAVLMMYRKEPWMTPEGFAKEKDDLYGAYLVDRNHYISYGQGLTEDKKYAIIATQRRKPMKYYSNGVVTVEDIAPTSFFFMDIEKNDVGKAIMVLNEKDIRQTNENFWERWCSLGDGVILNGSETEKLTAISPSGDVILKRNIYPADICESGSIYKSYTTK